MSKQQENKRNIPVPNPPIDADKVEQYANSSDFAFELQVASAFRNLKIPCEHTGLYADPVTGVSREYDLRARIEVQADKILQLAVECKNLRADYPLVVQCVTRTKQESFHELIVNHGQPVSLGNGRSKELRIVPSALYPIGKLVGKAFGQVGEKSQDTSLEPKFFDKYSQALQSTFEIMRACHELGNQDSKKRYHSILPVIVIPDGRMWQIVYTDEGGRASIPQKTSHISYKINKEWESGHIDHHNSAFTDFFRFRISHMEFVEIGYLKTFFDHFLGGTFSYENIFEIDQAPLLRPSFPGGK